MEEKGAYVVPKKDYKKIEDFVFNDRHGVNGPVAGKPARWIAEQAGVELPEGKDVMLFELSAKNIGEKLSSEKNFLHYCQYIKQKIVKMVLRPLLHY